MLIKYLAAVVLVAATAYAQFTGYKLIRIAPDTEEKKTIVGEWLNNEDFDIWGMKEKHMDVLLSPKAFKKYMQVLNENNVEYRVLNQNIQDNMDEEARSIALQKMQLKASGQEGKVVGTFGSYANTIAWMDQLAAANPSFVSTASAGKTYENRDLKYIIIKSSNANARNIWIDCGIHAREWIAPATCVHIIDAFIRERNGAAQAALSKFNIYVLPIHNPDGYAFSQSSSANRLWRKNRRVNSGSTCIGVDLNRNFGYQWMVAGASNNPCSDTYAGPTQDSEAETKAVEAVINSKRGTWDAFFTIHTYGQFWFTPWGYTSALPSDYSELVAKSNVGVAAIKAVNGLTFRVGSSTNLLYAAAGGSDDWAKGVAGVKYSHCLELRPADTGVDSTYGFQLPVDRVPKAGEETYRGILAFLNTF